jgi:hypothetical protein
MNGSQAHSRPEADEPPNWTAVVVSGAKLVCLGATEITVCRARYINGSSYTSSTVGEKVRQRQLAT